MRISKEEIVFLKEFVPKYTSGGVPYLFGSRVDDTQKRGDIDIAVLTTNKPPHTDIFKLKNLFYQNFGVQKLDIKCFTIEDNTAFRKYIFSYAIQL